MKSTVNGCVSDGIPIYHTKKCASWKIIAAKLANYHYFQYLMFLHIPVANVFQCFSIQMLVWVSCYRLDKKICVCPSLTQAVSITDTKYWWPKMRHVLCLNFNLEASFINLMGHENIGKSIVISKICFAFEKVMLKSPTFWPSFLTKMSQKHKMFFQKKMKLGAILQ